MENEEKPLTVKERVSRLQMYHRENRLIRGSWTNDEGDCCLLAAFSPEAEHLLLPCACPPSAMPEWLAYLTPQIDDFGSATAWPQMVARYVEVLPKLLSLPTEQLDALHVAACETVGTMPTGRPWSLRDRAITRALHSVHGREVEWDRMIDVWLTQWEQACAGIEVLP